MTVVRFAFVSSASLGLVASLTVVACGGSGGAGAGGSAASSTSATSTSSSASGTGTGGTGTGGSATSTSTSTSTTGTGTGGGATSTVTFSYTPEWAGVTAVTVVGAFGTSTDWTAPFATLTAGADGKWTGTATLPEGAYQYLFQVTGDAAATAGEKRYVIDPALSAFVKCTAGPTAGADPNPCSELTVPQPAADATVHVTGKVTYGGQPIKGYLALIERDEATSHHFFANRTDTLANGSFDLTVAAGQYRIQILHPTFLNTTDAARDPLTLKAQRRALSAAFMVTAAVDLATVEMEYLDYDKLTPTGTATLPTTLDFTVIAGAKGARAAVYGTAGGMGKNIGDPWYTSAYGTATSASFDGTFTTMQATETAVKTGEAYFWGTWQELAGGAPASWTGESMVFPIMWK